jgi:hypothetical protein
VGFPATLIERLRWLSAPIGTVGALGAVGGVLSADGPAVWRALGVFAVVVLVASWWTTCRRGEPRRFADAVGGWAMLVVVSTLAAPQQAQALLYPSVWFLSLYGSYRAAARNVAVLVAALLGGVVLSPAAHSAGFAVLSTYMTKALTGVFAGQGLVWLPR